MRGPARIHWLLLCAITALWAGAVLGGFLALERYARTPGETREPPDHWPASAGLARDPGKATLLCVLYPHCPCSRATIGELARLLALCEGRVAVHAYFWVPAGADEAWAQGPLWEAAAAIDGVTVRADVGGRAARRLGAATSGHVLLYAQDGRLLFSGGITAGCGQAGATAGSAAIVNGVRSGHPGAPAPVYGCPLHD